MCALAVADFQKPPDPKDMEADFQPQQYNTYYKLYIIYHF
jgi:hypothetical protein